MDKQLIQTYLDLVLRINEETDHAAFFSFSGHTQSITIFVTQSKVDFNTWIFNSNPLPLNMYSEYKKDFDDTIKELEKILKLNGE